MSLISKFNPRKKREYIRRATRVALQPLHEITFECWLPKLSFQLKIYNISFTGLGFHFAPGFRMRAGESMEGVLHVGQTTTSVKLRIAHLSPTLIGCSFEDLDPRIRMEIGEVLKAELHGLEMQKIPEAQIQADPSGLAPHWFLGTADQDPCELYFLSEGLKVKKFHLVLTGNYLEGGEGVVLRCGAVIKGQRDDIEVNKSSSLIHWNFRVDDELVGLVRRFIQSMAVISPEHRASLLQMLNNS